MSRRASLSPLVAALVLAAPEAHAVALTCGDFAVGAPMEADAIAPGFGSFFVQAPVDAQTYVPRNPAIRLQGDVSGLAADPPLFAIALRDPTGFEVPLFREGHVVRPTVELLASTSYTFTIAPTDAHPCPECEPPRTTSFTTGPLVDLVAPLIAPDDVRANVLVNAEDPCFDFGANHTLLVRLGRGAQDIALVEVAAARLLAGEPRALGRLSMWGVDEAFFAAQLGQDDLAIDEAVVVAFTPIDLAGNVGPALVLRVRAEDGSTVVDWADLDDHDCRVLASPSFSMPAELPANGRIHAAFPVEAAPQGLRLDDGTLVALTPVERDGDRVQTLAPVSPLPSSGRAVLEALPCPQCVCAGCQDDVVRRYVLGPEDHVPPAAPLVLYLREDLDPPAGTEGMCLPDESALIAVVAPGRDDRAAALELRYSATLRIDGGPALVVGRALAPALLPDGNHALRLETAVYGRLLSERLELELTVEDAAGNRASATSLHLEDRASCASVPRASGAPLVVLALLALARRARRGLRRDVARP